MEKPSCNHKGHPCIYCGMDERLITEVPEELRGRRFGISVSGGKDSTACLILLQDLGVNFQAVFADTGWEHPHVYEYLDTLETTLGITIERVSSDLKMLEKIRRRKMFPSRMRAWCTQELKQFPLNEWIIENRIQVMCTGVRWQESRARSLYEPIEIQSTGRKNPTDHVWKEWRPIIRYSLNDVVELHNSRSMPPNPMYLQGHKRVGCWPCIKGKSKEAIRAFAETSPERVDFLRDLEREISDACGEGKSFFHLNNRSMEESQIDKAIEWAHTKRGGKDLDEDLDDLAERESCMTWGLCETSNDGWPV